MFKNVDFDKYGLSLCSFIVTENQSYKTKENIYVFGVVHCMYIFHLGD
jgi:hypothetical protein